MAFDVRKTALATKRFCCVRCFAPTTKCRYSRSTQLEKGKELYAAAKQKGLEGHRWEAGREPYTGNRTSLWLKFKIVNELDAVIVGWTAPRRTRQYFGRWCWRHSTKKEFAIYWQRGHGFDQKTQKDLLAQLEKLRVARSPLHDPPKINANT